MLFIKKVITEVWFNLFQLMLKNGIEATSCCALKVSILAP